MHLKQKLNSVFSDPNTGVSKTATEDDFLIAKIYNLAIASTGGVFSGSFYLNFFWDNTKSNPFYTEFLTLPTEVIETYRIIVIPEGVTEIDIALVIQNLVYQYLLTLFSDWELVDDI